MIDFMEQATEQRATFEFARDWLAGEFRADPAFFLRGMACIIAAAHPNNDWDQDAGRFLWDVARRMWDALNRDPETRKLARQLEAEAEADQEMCDA